MFLDFSVLLSPPPPSSRLHSAPETAGRGAQPHPGRLAAPDYKTNPPTSGDHVEPPYQQADGAYTEMPAEIDFVHSLEHGRMEIQYSPDLPEKDQLELKGLYDTMYGATLLFPNDKMPYEVAATTWTNLLGCPTYKGAATLDAIRAFGKATWGKYGGEPARSVHVHRADAGRTGRVAWTRGDTERVSCGRARGVRSRTPSDATPRQEAFRLAA